MPIRLPKRARELDFRPSIAIAFASGVSASILAILLLVYSFNSGSERASGVDKLSDGKSVARATARDAGCEDQTWPYIDRRCLTPAPPRKPSSAPPATDDTSLSPDVEVRPAMPAWQVKAEDGETAVPETDGKSSASETPSSAPETPSASDHATREPAAVPDRPTAITGERPAKRASLPDVTLSNAPTNRAEKKAAIPFPRRKTKKHRRQATQSSHDNPDRIVRRWREVEYAQPDGSTRKIIIVKRGTLQRDRFFETAR